MKLRTKILGALAALFVVASPVQAQVVNPSSGNGTLLVAIWDGVKSVVVDLGQVTAIGDVSASGLKYNSANTGQSFDLSSYLTAAGINLASAQFMVFAGDSTGIGATNGKGLLSTVASGDATGTVAQTIASIANNLNTWSVNELNGTCAGAVSCSAALASASNYWDKGDWFTSVAWNAAGSVGGAALDLYKWVNAAGSTTYSTLGSVSLASNGVLSFATAAAVPLPAAGWLLLSGLGGLGAASRRRRKASSSAAA